MGKIPLLTRGEEMGKILRPVQKSVHLFALYSFQINWHPKDSCLSVLESVYLNLSWPKVSSCPEPVYVSLMLFKKGGGRTTVGSDFSALLRDCKMLYSKLGGLNGRESLKHKTSIVQTETENWIMGLTSKRQQILF